MARLRGMRLQFRFFTGVACGEGSGSSATSLHHECLDLFLPHHHTITISGGGGGKKRFPDMALNISL